VRILLVHNPYRWPGGEDRVLATEAEILKARGHEVFQHVRRNPAERGVALVRLAGQAFWNQGAYRELRLAIRDTRADVVHFHNTFPLISPAAYYAARREGAATVQTLHNYRLMCANGLFFRDGRPCEDCINTDVPWPAVVHACYRDSYAGSVVASGTVAVHRACGTWATQIDRYIALTDFARRKFIAGGLPADRIVVKPNVVSPDAGRGEGNGHFALFVGRLSREKGIETLLAAWQPGCMPLTIIGDGPLAPLVRRATQEHPGLTWLGQRGPEEVQDILGRATCLIAPSLWYETFGLVVAEAFARGTPVIASRLGALEELVDAGRTGLHFTPGDASDLGRQVGWMAAHPAAVDAMRRAARDEYERRYSADSNYPILCRIYADAVAAARAEGRLRAGDR
jgi:glycosyltransferase involved in cell wall biosynthesis